MSAAIDSFAAGIGAGVIGYMIFLAIYMPEDAARLLHLVGGN